VSWLEAKKGKVWFFSTPESKRIALVRKEEDGTYKVWGPTLESGLGREICLHDDWGTYPSLREAKMVVESSLGVSEVVPQGQYLDWDRLG